MPLARVVTFDGVSSDRMSQMRSEMESGDRPDDVPAKEIVVLHDPEAEKSLVILFFDTDEDYQRGDAALSAMPAGDTPGQRTSVTKYQVAMRMADSRVPQCRRGWSPATRCSLPRRRTRTSAESKESSPSWRRPSLTT